MMTEADVRRGVMTIRARFERPDVFPPLVRLIAQGEPVAIEHLAAASAISIEDLWAELARHPSAEWDDRGRIAGLGITLSPTPHSFTFDERTVYGWCATDALILPVLLGRSGVVGSTCPATGRRVRVEVAPDAVLAVDPPEAVVSEVRPRERAADVRGEVCHPGHFFASREAAAEWLEWFPEGHVNGVADDFELHRRVTLELGWVAR
jgi:alkylmercury lyase